MTQHAHAPDMNWPALLKGIGVQTINVLRRAELPDDLFARSSARLETAAYFRLWGALEAEAGDAAFPLRLYGVLRSEFFSPPLFAALCSPNLVSARRRLSRYKALVAPVRLDVDEEGDEVSARLTWLEPTPSPPPTLVAAELLFFVYLARTGTHGEIRPLRVVAEVLPGQPEAYSKFLGAPVRQGKGHSIVFSRHDATKPFLSTSDAMWSIFEPALRRALPS